MRLYKLWRPVEMYMHANTKLYREIERERSRLKILWRPMVIHAITNLHGETETKRLTRL